MWNKFLTWSREHDMQISWFIIGFFTVWFMVDIERHDFLGAAIDAFVVAVNVAFRPRG